MRHALLIFIFAACNGRAAPTPGPDDAAYRNGVRRTRLLLQVLQEQNAAGQLPNWKTWDPPIKHEHECVHLGSGPGCDTLPEWVYHAILLPDVDRLGTKTFRAYNALWLDLSKDGARKKLGDRYVDVQLVGIDGYEILRINAADDVQLIGALSKADTKDVPDGEFHVIIHNGGTLRFSCASKRVSHPFSCSINDEGSPAGRVDTISSSDLNDVGIVYRAADRDWHIIGATHEP
jgi:hypothetical protein